MVRYIFIFSNILVYFLTIVSKQTLGNPSVFTSEEKQVTLVFGKDTTKTIVQDDFEDGNCQDWKLTEGWEVSSVDKISGDFSLKHSSTTTNGSTFLFHRASIDWNSSTVEWSFKLKNGNWDPSSSNRFWFYLSADTIRPDLVSGWAVGVNISGSSDLLELWRIRNGKADTLVVQTDLDWNASTLASISVKRTAQGIWMLGYQKPGETTVKTFTGSDKLLFPFRNIGLYFNYTVTRAGQLWLDDVSVIQRPAELFIQNLTVVNSHTLRLTFNKPINPASIHVSNFSLTDETGQPVQVTQAQLTSGSNRSVDITFGKTSGITLSLNTYGISDLSGGVLLPDSRSFSYSILPEAGTILINEILFNPFSGGVDFVELINISEQPIPVHRLMLATRNDTLALKQIYSVSTEKRYLKPGELLVCTKDPAALATQYISCDSQTFCTMKSFPSFPDDAGTVVLLNDSLDVLDEFSYTAKMHSPFLADEEGVSLERISLGKPTNNPINWASAAESVGFATPGLPNSQTGSETEIQDEITPEPKAFSPNGDGYNDELAINFKLSKPGYMANVRIFDAVGRLIVHLVKNQSLAQDGSWTWDGKNDSGQKLNIGVYIILVELFDQGGHSKAFKKTCTLTDRLE